MHSEFEQLSKRPCAASTGMSIKAVSELCLLDMPRALHGIRWNGVLLLVVRILSTGGGTIFASSDSIGVKRAFVLSGL